MTRVLLNSFGDRVVSLPSPCRKKQRHTITLKVPSMHCEGCVKRAQEVVGRVHGVEDVEVNLAQKLVTVTYRNGTSVGNDIKQHIADAGHVLG